MRILHVTTFLQGGAGRIIAALAIAQRRQGHDVTVVADDGGADGYGSYPEYLAALTAAGVPVVAVRSTFTRDLPLAMQAAQQVRAIAGPPPDVVHTHAAIPTLVARIAFGRGGRRVVQTMHGWGIAKTAEQAATDITLLGAADVVVTPSVAARETLRSRGLTGPIDVVPYGLEADPATRPIDADDAARVARLRSGGRAIALCIGTIGARKNQRLLVEALASLDTVSGLFVGDGDTTDLARRAEAHGITDRIGILGYREQADRYLSVADVLVLPSRNEGLPIAVLEALRAGVPVVATALPEIAEAVDEGRSGFLVPADDAAALSAAVGRAVTPGVRAGLATACRAIFADRYRLERMTAAYERLYAAPAR